MHRWIARFVASAVVLAAFQAKAAGDTADLDELAGRVAPVLQQARELDAQVQASGKDYLSAEEAMSRYQDNVYAFMVGDHRQSAEGFFGLVTTGALDGLGLSTDAEWYLAESLHELDNYITAEGRYRAIIEDRSHPFREDAVRRLLELFSESGNVEAFETFYQSYVVSGGISTTPAVRYAVAKSFFAQGRLEESVAEFGRIRPGPVDYAKAQYWLGALRVTQGDLNGAVSHFGAAADQSVDSVESRDVVDLAWLALGRIAYERGELQEALEHYNRVSVESTYTPDKYYELVWTSIRREEWKNALNSIDIFLLAYPDHEYAAQLQLIRGQLHMQIASRTDGFRRDDSYTAALGAFEAVVAAYAPVRDRFRSLSANESDPSSYLQEVVYLDAGGRDALPAFALSMMRADPELARAIDVFADLGTQERDLTSSERLVDELRTVFQVEGGLAHLARVQVDSALYRLKAVTLGLELLSAEEAFLLGGGAPSGRMDSVQSLGGALLELRSRVDVVSAEIESGRQQLNARSSSLTIALKAVVDGRSKVSELVSRIDQLKRSISVASGPDLDAAGRKLDATLGALSGARDELVGFETDLARLEAQGRGPRLVVDDSLRADIVELHTGYIGLRAGGGGSDGERIDRMFEDLERAHVLLDGVESSLDTVVASETERIRARFDMEVAEVRAQRDDLARTRHAGEAVSVNLTREGFGRLEGFFSENVLKADSGIIDVYWAQKLQTADEIDRVKRERTELLQELEARFTLIRQKIGE
jgi:tetratricopeptide (TPR) repeat protein